MDEVETVADDDKRQLVRELGFLEEVLDLLGVVVVGLSADALDFSDLTSASSGLNVFEVHLGVGREVDDGTEVVVETLERLEGLEHLDELDRAKEVRVLGSDLNDDLKILADVDLEHLTKALERLFDGELAEVVDKPLGLEQVGVNNDTLDVGVVLVVLKSALQETGLLAKVGNARTIVVSEHLVAEDGIGDLRSVDQVHLEQTSLKVSLLGLVVLECVEEERGSLLDHVLAHEDVSDTLDVDQRTRLVADQAAGEFSTLLGVGANNVLEQRCVVWSVSDLLGVKNNLVELTRLGEAGNDLVGNVGTKVDTEGQVHVVLADNVTELLAAFDLALLEPLLEQVLATLVKNGTGKLERLELVERTLLEEDTKVLEDGRKSAGLVRDLLELLDGLSSSKNAAWRVGGDLGGLTILACGEEGVELLKVEVVGTWKVTARSELEGEFRVVESAKNVRNDGVLIDRDGKDLTLAVDTNDTAGRLVLCSDKDGVARDAVHVDASAALEIVEVNEAVLCDEVDNTVTLADLHGNGEVVGGLGWEEDIDGLFGESGLAILVVDLYNVKLGTGGSAVGKGEKLERVGCCVGLELCECGSVTLDGLRDTTVARVKLHGTLDTEGVGSARGVSRDTNKNEPFLVLTCAVVDDLCTLQADVAIKDLGGCGFAFHGPMEYCVLGDNTESGVADPFPEGDVLGHEMRLYF